jgi:hypothetical protein
MAAPSARAALLAETAWLAERLDDPQLSIVDIRGAVKANPVEQGEP